MWTNQLDQLIGLASLSISLSISLEVSEITDVTGLVLWCTMGLAVWVDYIIYQSKFHLQSLASYGGGVCQEIMAYSEDQQMCSRWCCHQTGEHGILAQHWRRCR